MPFASPWQRFDFPVVLLKTRFLNVGDMTRGQWPSGGLGWNGETRVLGFVEVFIFLVGPRGQLDQGGPFM